MGSHAYTVSGTGGFKIVNLSNPSYPTIVGGISTAESAIRLDVLGNYAYVTAGKGYLYVIDITNPQSPVLKDSLQVGTSSVDHGKGIMVVGSYAYVVTYESGLHIVNVSDPENISQEGYFYISNTSCVEVYGNYAYVGKTTGGMQIVDITSPTNPTNAGSFSGFGVAYRTTVRGTYLFIANGDLVIYDITSPTTPSLIESFSMSNITMDVNLSEDGMFAYLANCNDQGGYAVVVNISDIDDPVLECSFYDRWIKSVGIFGKLAISGSSTGLKTAEFDLPPVLSVSVNPDQGRVEGRISGQQNLIINCGDGQTDCSELLSDLDQVELIAYPKAGYAFDYFDDGTSCEEDNPLTLTMNGDVSIEGVFEEFGFRCAAGDFRFNLYSIGGQCTEYVRAETDIEIYGNANTWYQTAINDGYYTSQQPANSAIIVFDSQENMPYGHVGIVVNVDGNNITIRDSNWCENDCEIVNQHIINLSQYDIVGYIYCSPPN